MGVSEFFHRRERECDECGVTPDGDYWQTMVAENVTDSDKGHIFGQFRLTPRAYLDVHEAIEMDGHRGHRIRYAYFLVVDEEKTWGYERYPTHDPAEHWHDADHVSRPHPPISFKDACDKAWATVTTVTRTSCAVGGVIPV